MSYESVCTILYLRRYEKAASGSMGPAPKGAAPKDTRAAAQPVEDPEVSVCANEDGGLVKCGTFGNRQGLRVPIPLSIPFCALSAVFALLKQYSLAIACVSGQYDTVVVMVVCFWEQVTATGGPFCHTMRL
jgi:hypothetical protein|eukprot:COSAG03_NODE_5217_length_1310_cov_954.729149_3_plen_131_part_00